MKEIIPDVNENLNMTESEKEYKKILGKLNKRRKQRNFGILGIVLGFAGVGTLLAAFLALSAGSMGAVMSFSPWMYVPFMSVAGVVVATGWTAAFVNPEIKELKRLERRYAPDIAEDRKKEIDKMVENDKSLSDIKKENDKFLNDKQNEIGSFRNSIKKVAQAKVDVDKNITLSKPKEEFSPTEELKFLKQLKEQAKEVDAERKRKEFMDTMMQGMNNDKGNR